MSQLVWPAWFPYPISWLRALANLASFALIGQFVSRSLISRLRWSEGFEPEELTIVLLWCLLVHFFLIVLVHHSIMKLLYERKAWWPGWFSWREGLNGAIVIILTVFGTSFFILFLAIALGPQTREQNRLFVTLMGIALVALGAYIYHYDYLVRHRRAARPAKRSTNVEKKGGNPPSPPADPTDVEINRLRGEMGLNQMKQVRRKPKDK